uniref:F-box domain-containing protein n=1 Tax=Oryza nivara TaxID=4536 RepID=A0A0E0HMX8_ORYNI
MSGCHVISLPSSSLYHTLLFSVLWASRPTAGEEAATMTREDCSSTAAWSPHSLLSTVCHGIGLVGGERGARIPLRLVLRYCSLSRAWAAALSSDAFIDHYLRLAKRRSQALHPAGIGVRRHGECVVARDSHEGGDDVFWEDRSGDIWKAAAGKELPLLGLGGTGGAQAALASVLPATTSSAAGSPLPPRARWPRVALSYLLREANRRRGCGEKGFGEQGGRLTAMQLSMLLAAAAAALPWEWRPNMPTVSTYTHLDYHVFDLHWSSG